MDRAALALLRNGTPAAAEVLVAGALVGRFMLNDALEAGLAEAAAVEPSLRLLQRVSRRQDITDGPIVRGFAEVVVTHLADLKDEHAVVSLLTGCCRTRGRSWSQNSSSG
jgi:hypothetical protein